MEPNWRVGLAVSGAVRGIGFVLMTSSLVTVGCCHSCPWVRAGFFGSVPRGAVATLWYWESVEDLRTMTIGTDRAELPLARSPEGPISSREKETSDWRS